MRRTAARRARLRRALQRHVRAVQPARNGRNRRPNGIAPADPDSHHADHVPGRADFATGDGRNARYGRRADTGGRCQQPHPVRRIRCRGRPRRHRLGCRHRWRHARRPRNAAAPGRALQPGRHRGHALGGHPAHHRGGRGPQGVHRRLRGRQVRRRRQRPHHPLPADAGERIRVRVPLPLRSRLRLLPRRQDPGPGRRQRPQRLRHLDRRRLHRPVDVAPAGPPDRLHLRHGPVAAIAATPSRPDSTSPSAAGTRCASGSS